MNEFHSPEHERLARAAVDDSRLLDGEDPESNLLEDARHWLVVYKELAGFKQSILDQIHEKLPDLSGVTAAELSSVDIVIIRQQLERYKRRIAFWERRTSEVTHSVSVTGRPDGVRSPSPTNRVEPQRHRPQASRP
jgi:hypothetical protein